jgi:hypothetical protein
MRSFKVKFAGQNSGGSFLVSIDETHKSFDVSNLGASRAPFGLVIHAVEYIVATEFDNPLEMMTHNRVAPFKVHRQDNMSTSKVILQILHQTKILGREAWVPKVAAQLTCSCNMGTGFGWDERNNCTFLPDLAELSRFLHEQCPKWMEHYEWQTSHYEINVYDSIPADWTLPSENKSVEKPVESDNDEDKLVID